jgi:hypothetical protein
VRGSAIIFFFNNCAYHSLRERDDISLEHVEQDCVQNFLRHGLATFAEINSSLVGQITNKLIIHTPNTILAPINLATVSGVFTGTWALGLLWKNSFVLGF